MERRERESPSGQSTGSRLVLCRCCVAAECDQHMTMVAERVLCVVCGEACQCAGCAAHYNRDNGHALGATRV